nr:hypothetical protein BaRGS_016097 [Batillaria attramentaria]
MHRVQHETQVVAGLDVNVPQTPVKLQFGDYLNQPCYAPAASQFPRPADLSNQNLQGDFDVLILHRNLGLIAGEIKSVGIRAEEERLTDQQLEDDVLNTLKKMLKMHKKPATGRRQPRKGQLKKSEEVLSYILDLINMAPDLAYLAGPPGTGKTLTTVIMSLEWLRQNGTVDILSWYTYNLAAAHLIKQQLQETARLILGEQAASRVHLHDNLKQDGAVDRLVATLTARPTSDVCLIADEAEGFGDELDVLYRALVNKKMNVRLTRQHFHYDNSHNNVLQQHRYNDLNR